MVALERGFDTETINGYVRVAATDREAVEIRDLPGILDFMRKYEGHVLWTWNLQYDAQAILKYFGAKTGKRLWEEGEVVLDGVSLKYIPAKFLRFLFKGKAPVRLYDMAQFYGCMSLDSQAKKMLGERKQDVGQWIQMCKAWQRGEKTLEELEDYFDTRLPLIKYYCQNDALLTLKLARLMRDGFNAAHIAFGCPISTAQVAERYIRKYNRAMVKGKLCYRYPRVWPSWKLYHDMAYLSYHGGMFETLRRGHIERPLFSYDINSAYPSVMQHLPHWGNGYFATLDSCEGQEPTPGRFGWHMCEFDCRWVPYPDIDNPETIEMIYKSGPVEFVRNNKRVLFPSGKRLQPITSWEYEWMRKKGYPCRFLKGIEWVHRKDRFKPPFGFVASMYDERLRIKKADPDDMRQMALKLVINSAYGKTAQIKHGMGRLTNFFYCSFMTAGCRLKVAEIAHSHPGHVIEIATDGILLDKPVNQIEIGDKLGQWTAKEYDSGLFVGSGIRQLWKAGKAHTYARGLDGNPDYDLKAAIEKHKGEKELLVAKIRPIQLGEVIAHSKVLKWDDLNQFQPVKRRLSVNTDRKHRWERDYESWGDFLEHEQGCEPLRMGVDLRRT